MRLKNRTGVTIKEDTGEIDMPDEWWQERSEEIPDAMRIKKHPLVCLHLMESVFRNCRVGDEPAQSPSLSRLNQQTMTLTETEEIVPNTQIPEDDGTQEAMTDTNQNEDVTETPNGVQSSSRRGRQPRRRSAIENVIENSAHFIMEYLRCLTQANYASAFVALEEEEKIDWLEAITGFNKDGERFNDYETGSGCNGFVGVSSGLQGRSQEILIIMVALEIC
ncbi:hypothetical protein Bca4012_020815 [Brassica carinata]